MLVGPKAYARNVQLNYACAWQVRASTRVTLPRDSQSQSPLPGAWR